jgi:hypothetical protein
MAFDRYAIIAKPSTVSCSFLRKNLFNPFYSTTITDLKTNTENLSLRLESELVRRLDALAESQNKSRAQYLREVLEVAADNKWRVQYQIVQLQSDITPPKA